MKSPTIIINNARQWTRHSASPATKNSRQTNSMNGSLARPFLLIPLVLAYFAVSPQARATCRDACLTNDNTVQGDDALISNTTGFANTATGFEALFTNTNGDRNTATGAFTLVFNTEGSNNTANGFAALQLNTTGFDNTAIGSDALFNNATGKVNTATGFEALFNNITGNVNTAIGAFALEGNTEGNNNTATGYQALKNSTSGSNNTATGANALLNNTTGGDNIALGQSAGANLTTGSANIDIGNTGVAGEANTIRIGTQGTQTGAFIAGISGATVPTGVAVIVDTTGHLGTTTSSERFKESIKPMDRASEAILALKPVTFRYKKELDPGGVPQFGLVAEQVEKVDPDLVARDAEGKPYSVRYEAVNAMLLNEFLKERRTVQQQQKEIDALKAELKEQRAFIQAVNDEVELHKPAPQTVLNNQ